ncbi:histidine--tRNA ligase [Fidelibacter multiformis]|jgi:histidyl-tRNA synthetase|uniref:histidine--tRNA ligase n=1 Tax=Fidelibacter multiformis TaxID=3377529 RepID=UPI0037DD7E7D
MKSLNAVKGTKDILPWESPIWHHVESVCRDVFSSAFYQEVRTPVFEKTELFARGIGEFSDIVSKEMYTFQDKGGEWLTLRPEYTASVIRSYIQHHYEQQSPLQKLWYVGPLFRQERPQAGRLRQFHQFGIELIGSEYPEADAEVITLACQLYKKVGLRDWELHINSIGNTKDRLKYIQRLSDSLKPHFNDFCPVCRERFDKNILRLFDCKNESCQKLLDDHAPKIIDHLSPEDKSHFDEVCTLLDVQGIAYTINPKLVRGLDYYTRTTFEIKGKQLGAQDALCGGGRYDNLVEELGGKPTPAVGFAAGIERLILALEAEKKSDITGARPDLYMATLDVASYEGILKTCTALRDQGYIVETDLLRRSVKAMMRDANKKQARYVTVVGPDELESGTLTLKNLETGKTSQVSWNELGKALGKEIYTPKI